MTEKPEEGNTNADGGSGANQQSSQAELDSLKANLAAAKKENADLKAERSLLQGKKDKDISRLESEIARIAKYLPNVTPEEVAQAQRASVLDEIVAERLVPVSPTSGQSETQKPTVEVGNIAKLYDLDLNDPFVSSRLSSLDLNDPEKAELGMARIARDKKNQPNPTSAQAPATPGAPAGPKTAEDLMVDYKKELANIPHGDILHISNLQARYRKLGLTI